jgi:predicted Zn-dependent peptidase
MIQSNGNARVELGKTPSGLRVALRTQRGMPVVYLGLAVAVGARHESDNEQGMAHYCEHMAFKGTRRRTSLQIIRRLEGVGGELNAFTTKEDTVLHAACERRHLHRALDLLTDIAFESQYPQEEMEREVEVICDEIDSYRDTPSELIYDEFEDLLFPSHPLGHGILGQAEQLRGYTREQLASFARRRYREDNAVLFCWGDVSMKDLGRMLGGCEPVEGVDTPLPPRLQLPSGTGMTVRTLSTHQAHVVVGCQACAARSEDRPALYLLNNILGGPAMNARLNVALRERRGLVYTVESTLACYSDTGAWTTYLGCDPSDVKRCLGIVHREMDRLCQQALTQRTLAAARQQLHGQLALATQNLEQMAIDMGRTTLHSGRPRLPEEFLAQVDALTPEQLLTTAQRYFAPERMLTLIYR